jgi:hypothetical protein
MTVNIAGKTVAVADLLALAGGIVAIVGVPLAWITMNMGGDSESVGGLDDGLLAGKIALVLGVLIVVAAGISILKLAKIPQAGLIQIALGALLVVVVGLVYFTKILSDESFTHTADMMKAVGGSAGIGIGVILEVVGALLAIGGGVLAIVKKA